MTPPQKNNFNRAPVNREILKQPYIYIHMYICTHTHTNIYIYIHVLVTQLCPTLCDPWTVAQQDPLS